MLLVKTYAVMDCWVVEASCIHGADPTQSHLVYREELRAVTYDVQDMWASLSEAMVRAATLVHRGELETNDECPL